MDIRKRKLKGYIALSILIIMCLIMASAMTFIIPNNNVNAIKSENMSSQATDLGDLLLKEHGTAGAKAFNAEKFWELISKISNGQVTDMSKFSTLGAIPTTSEDFRSYNSGKDIVVTIGGQKWIATYLSQNNNADPILTFWLANNATTAKYNQQAQNFVGVYPNNMYGTSYIRASVLNNGSGYAAHYYDTELTSISQSETSEWAIYTMTKDKKNTSIKEYLEVPNNMSWQLEQKAKDYVTSTAYVGSYYQNNNNDALNLGGSLDADHDYFTNTTVNTTGYQAWGNDTLWLPSITETGVNGVEGIWKATNSTRANSAYSWLRSANSNNYGCSYCLDSNGSDMGDFDVNAVRAVRPAFHLNLTKAEKASGISTIPSYKKTTDNKDENIKYYSNGNDVTFELDKISEGLVDIEITATDMDGKDMTASDYTPKYIQNYTVVDGVLSFKIQNVGKYTVKVSPKQNKYWKDGTNGIKKFDYYLKYKLTDVAWKTASTNTVTYNGKDQYLELINYDDKKMTITPVPVKVAKDASGNIIKDENGNLWAIKVKDFVDKTTDADKAKVKVELKNTTYMVWNDKDLTTGAKNLEFTVNKKALNATLVKTEEWKTEVNTDDTTYDLWIDCFEEDLETIKFEGYYKKDGSSEEKKVTIAPEFAKDNDEYVKSEDGKKYKLTITLPEITEKGNYKYILKLAEQGSTSNKNYSLSFERAFATDNKSIDIREEDIVWQYRNVDLNSGEYLTVDKTKLDSDNAFCVTYNGKEFTLRVDTDSETSKLKKYVNDVDFNIVIIGNDDKEVDGKNVVADVLLKNNIVTYYTVKLTITAKKDKTGLDLPKDPFTFRFKINKAKFDLSNVTWDYDPKKPKEYNGGKNLEVKLTGLPAVLVADYYDNDKGEDSNISSKVCEIDSKTNEYKPYIAKVTFKFNDKLANVADIKKNYELPDKDDKTTYICKEKNEQGELVDKDFPWELEWIVKKAELDLASDWEYDPKKPKEYNGGKNLEVKLTGLPAVLVADYYDNDKGEDSNISSKVCEIDSKTNEYKPYIAKVTFKFNDKLANVADIKKNYELPDKDDKTTYICKEKNEQGELVDKDFPWELEWIVKKAELDLASDWEKVAKEDKNNVVFRPFEISDKTKAAKIVYEYYKEAEWDNVNCVVIGNATPKKLEDIVVDLDSEPEKYWVVAKVNEKNFANYEIKKGTQAKKFTVGAGTVIDIDMDKEFTYDGKAHGVKVEFKFNGKGNDEHDAIADIIVKKYYSVEKGENGEEDKKTELAKDDVPTKAGTYIVSIDFDDEE
ncbi:MAG: hypothetical protein K2J13_02470, partial [Clostridia bacterium]|nr:hypothetical protein [Clostridia bacterium]